MDQLLNFHALDFIKTSIFNILYSFSAVMRHTCDVQVSSNTNIDFEYIQNFIGN